MHGPGFDVSIPAGYVVTSDGTGGSDFQAALGGETSTPYFVVVHREPFGGSLAKAVDYYQTVVWKGVQTVDLGPANLSGAGAVGRHMIITGRIQGNVDAYVFVHQGLLWELRISTDDADRARVAASFRLTD